MFETLIGILILGAAIWAIINIVQSGTTTGKKVLWVLFVLFFPVVGFIVWFLIGPKSATVL